VSRVARAVRGSRARLAALLLGVLAVLLWATPVTYAAAGSSSDERTVGDCLAAGEVWLYVRDERGEVLRSECVGTPATGLAALEAAGVATTEATGGYLCTLAGHPSRCSTRYTGQYWQYWHTTSTEDRWRYSQQGADSYRPAPSTIEGWCYNRSDEERCALPRLSDADTPAPRVDATAEPSSDGRWSLALVAATLTVLGGAALWLRRRPASS
jgi:hypothetical protein